MEAQSNRNIWNERFVHPNEMDIDPTVFTVLFVFLFLSYRSIEHDEIRDNVQTSMASPT